MLMTSYFYEVYSIFLVIEQSNFDHRKLYVLYVSILAVSIMMSNYDIMWSYFCVWFGVKMFVICEGLILFIVLKISVGEVRNHFREAATQRCS